MCGIAGFYVKDGYQGEYDLEKLADSLLLSIEHRGQDATGYFAASKGATEFTLMKQDIPATYFTQLREFLPDNVRMFVGHTRLATQGDPKDNKNNHPVNVKSCFVTHNGVIYNDKQIIDEVLGDDEKRTAEVDSIAVPHLITHCGIGKALEELPRLQGSWALAIADPLEAPDKLLLVRGTSSPLVVLDHRNLVVWASEFKALEEAWSEAIGTPPATRRFNWLGEGEAVTITPEEVTTTRFMEEPKFYSTGWDDDSSYSSRSFGTEVRRAQNKKMCFECGERTAYFSIVDSYTDGERYVEWDVPLCYTCEQIVGGDLKALSYRHSDEQIKIRHRKADEKCFWCVTKTATRFDKNGDAVCDDCTIGDALPEVGKKEETHRPFASFKADDPNQQNILSLVPGDPIPESLGYAFGDCDVCSSHKAKVIGAGGFPICWECRQGELLPELKMEWSKPKDRTALYKECDLCDTHYPADEIKDTVMGFACRGCRYNWQEEKTEPKSVVAALMGYVREAEEYFEREDAIPLTPIEKDVAKHLQKYDKLVGWMLRFCNADKTTDPIVHDLWKDAVAKYEELKWAAS